MTPLLCFAFLKADGAVDRLGASRLKRDSGYGSAVVTRNLGTL